MKVVLASGNPGKLRELKALLEPLGVDLIAQTDLGIRGAEETAPTFLENALLKARHAAALSGHPAIADDSGLVVPALDGAPGVRSARYAGEDAGDLENNARLIRDLAVAGYPEGAPACFYCAIAYLNTPDDPTPIVATGRWWGRIIPTPRGGNGFGYDPHFYLSELDATAAELSGPFKNQLSHRGQAVRTFLDHLRRARILPGSEGRPAASRI